MTTALSAPFPWFGGKGRAAPLVWAALGDPSRYIEPFAGSIAVLLGRPARRGYRSEIVNDVDGWLVNAWRSIKLDPAAVADHATWPITEIDYHARLAWLQARRGDLVSWLEGDPEAHDPKAAGWWLYVVSANIGPWSAGPWQVVEGHLVDTRTLDGGPVLDPASGVCRSLPDMGGRGKGRGIHRFADRAAVEQHLVALANRLSEVRITCGDWSRVVTPGVLCGGSGGDGATAVFLDPPYATSGDLYATSGDTSDVANKVRDWCIKAPPGLRIVLAGYDAEHDYLLDCGWRRIVGKSGRGSGYSKNPLNGRRERLWISPGCLDTWKQEPLWGQT